MKSFFIYFMYHFFLIWTLLVYLDKVLMKKTLYLSLVFYTSILLFACSQRNEQNDVQPKDSINLHVIDSLNETAFKVKRVDIVKALNYLSVSQGLASKINYQKGLAVANLYEAGIYQQSGYSNKALSIYYKALNIAKANNDTFNIARCNIQIAAALKDNKDFDAAEKLYKESLQFFKKLNKPEEVVNINNSIGQLFISKKNTNEAKKYFDVALAESIAMNYVYGEKKSYQNLGLIELSNKNIDKAEAYFLKAKKIDLQQNDYYGLALSNMHLAEVAEYRKNYQGVLLFGLDGFVMAKQANAFSLMDANIQFILKAYKKQNNYAKIALWQDSLMVFIKEQNQKDKQYAINFIELVKNQETQKIEAQKKVAENIEVSNWQIFVIIIVTLLLGIISVITFVVNRNYKVQRAMGIDLANKNIIIEKNITSLDDLNQAISIQNHKLEDENRMKDKLLSIISHDLRHPMVNTKSIVELINLGMVTPEETKELMNQLEGQYVRSIGLLDNLLFWLRGQMQGKSIEKSKVNIHQLITGLMDEQSLNLSTKKITLLNETEATPIIQADKEMLKVVFRNLISNAIKFTPPQGLITASCKTTTKDLFIYVKDNGVGMSKDIIEKVNARQYYSGTGTEKEKGTGFGLILCRDLIANHNGTLNIESELGNGSTFIVQLPL